MKLSSKARYAVMAMVDLAEHGGKKPTALAEIADRQDISLSYLEQIFTGLRRGGLVRSVRGPGGGYLLARPSDQVRIAEVMMAVEGPERVVSCRPGSPATCRGLPQRCATHDLWEALGHQVYGFLSSITIADVNERRIRPANWSDAPAPVSNERAMP